MLVERGCGGSGGGGQTASSSTLAAAADDADDAKVFVQPAAHVAAVVDTTGAGDCFTAAYCVSWLRERERGEGKRRESEPAKQQQQERLRFATAAAALCVSRAGALPSMPSLAEVEGFLEEAGEAERGRENKREF